MLFERLDITSNLKLLTLPISLNFNLIYGKTPERGIIFSMIMRDEDATLRNSNNSKNVSLS